MASEAHLYDFDPPSMPFFGANPCWTPAREHYHSTPDRSKGPALTEPARQQGAVSKPVPHSPNGDSQGRTANACPVCGGQAVQGTNNDPLGHSELVVNVCMRCMRGAGRRKNHITGAVGEGDDSRSGRMAAKITGKGDPKLNAYLSPVLTAEQAARMAQPSGKAPEFKPNVGKGRKDKTTKGTKTNNPA
jgi:hypothetical protein